LRATAKADGTTIQLRLVRRERRSDTAKTFDGDWIGGECLPDPLVLVLVLWFSTRRKRWDLSKLS
jgi:hypothetical protein